MTAATTMNFITTRRHDLRTLHRHPNTTINRWVSGGVFTVRRRQIRAKFGGYLFAVDTDNAFC